MTRASPTPDKAGHLPSRGNGRDAGTLAGCTVVITRPAGTGAPLAKRVRAWGGTPLLLPGLSLRAAVDRQQARARWRQAQRDDVLIFTSPAAVRYAWQLAPLRQACGQVIAVGQGTARALHRRGISVQAPAHRQDSEGVLALPSLKGLRGKRVAVITAPGGRGLLQQQLGERGAALREVHVYRRTAPRLTLRHRRAVRQLPLKAFVLVSSAEALKNLQSQLPVEVWKHLCRAIAVVSSERMGAAARSAGFLRIKQAASAHQADLLKAVCEAHACTRD